MLRQQVYVVCAEGEEALAEELAEPLRAEGYEVAHCGTVLVGDSLIGTATKALATGEPIILCGTTRSVGSAWAHRIVNAAHTDGRVFVVHMEAQAYIDQLAVRTKVARYCDDPAKGLRELVEALAKRFPPTKVEPKASTTPVSNGQYLDQLTELTVFDVNALSRFRATMREGAVRRLPASLTPWQFLEQAALLVSGRLTRAGVLLFGINPTRTNAAAMVKCVRYHGTTRAATREAEDVDGRLTDQIIAAREFVARHVRRGELPSGSRAQAVPVYAYPMIAVREIIANALVHRDYSAIDAWVHVRIFDDRVEVSSPGSWLGDIVPSGVSRELTEFEGQSLKRNLQLALVVSWASLVEADGSGIPSAVRDCRNAGSPMPTVLRENDFITVTIWPRPPEESTSTSRPLIPATLPRDSTHFVGRENELAQLRLLPVGVVVISGIAGVGKTALAVQFAHRVRDQFPDGQLYLDLRGFTPDGRPVDPVDALASLLTMLGVSGQAMPSDAEARAGLYRSLLADRRMLVLLDNASSAEQVLPLLPGTSECLVIVTCRAMLPKLVVRAGAAQVSLDVLDHDTATSLLVRCLGTDLVRSELTVIREIVHYCGGLPLALRIVAAQIDPSAPESLHELVAELRDESTRLAALDTAGSESMATVFATAYRGLNQRDARLFRLISLHPGPDVSVPAISAMIDLDEVQVRRAVQRLCSAHLLEHTHRRYRFHDLLRLYAQEQASIYDSAEDRDAARLRVLQYYVQRGEVAEPQWFADEMPVLLATVDFATEAGFSDEAWHLAKVITPVLDEQGRWEELVKIQTKALRMVDDPAKQAFSYRSLGIAGNQLGHLQVAHYHYTLAIELYQQLGDQRGEAHSMLALAEVHGRRDQLKNAISWATRARVIFEALGDLRGQAAAIVTMANYQVQTGQLPAAFDHLTTARRIYQELNDVRGESSALHSLGLNNHRLGNLSAAVRDFEAALELSRAVYNRYAEAVTLNRLGDAYESMGEAAKARTAWGQALVLLTEFGDPDAGTVQAKLSRWDVPPGRVILVVDNVGSGRTDSAAPPTVSELVRAVFGRVKIAWDQCWVAELGDGMVVLPPDDVPDSVFVNTLPYALATAVGRHPGQIRLRVALHTGEVQTNRDGLTGVAVNYAFRLVDAAPLKYMLRQSDSPIAMIVSDSFYERVVRKHAELRDYRSVEVGIKETRANAWLYTPPTAEA